ncbi:MAG: MmgE/PrpD family protein [Candidatus Manganitrophaceae bacterium]|nr:MAG: MmgE/PrpD family protein [Candidatus Manganitrophaceae bacterium]
MAHTAGHEIGSTLAQRLAHYSRALSYRLLPSEVVHEVKRRLIDTLGCALGGWESAPAKIARKVARSVQFRAGAALLGEAHRTTEDLAAFANGTAVRYLDYNDTYLSKEPAHPSDNIPAALAAAEAAGRGGKALIEAIVLGYDIQCRLCDAAALRPKGWDHVTYGAFSSALVAAKLWRLTEEKTIHAVGLAGTPNQALRQTRVGEISMWKAAAFANAVRNGLFAVELARLGMTGPAPIFEGEKGFMKVVSGEFDLPPLHPAGPFKIMETYIKYFPVEYHAQSAVQAALLLRKRLEGGIDSIESITIRTPDVSYEIIGRDPEKWHPKTRETADHSLPYCVAAALMDGEMGLRQFGPRRLVDPKLHLLMQKVRVLSDPELSAAYPGAIANIVEVEAHGRREVERVDHPRGHPKNPVTDDEVEEKFRRLAGRLLSKLQVEKVLGRIWALEKVQSIGEILTPLKVRGKR